MLDRGRSAIAAVTLAHALAMGATFALASDKTSRAPDHPARCPQSNRQPLTSQGEAAKTTLVPDGARSVLLCRYRGLDPSPDQLGKLEHSRRITRKATLKRLVRRVNALRPIVPGVAACPFDDASKIVAFFHNSDSPDDPVSFELGGCRAVSSSQLTRTAMYEPGPRLLAELEQLTGCNAKPICR